MELSITRTGLYSAIGQSLPSDGLYVKIDSFLIRSDSFLFTFNVYLSKEVQEAGWGKISVTWVEDKEVPTYDENNEITGTQTTTVKLTLPSQIGISNLGLSQDISISDALVLLKDEMERVLGENTVNII
jgi:hypothetical protein